MLYPLSYWGICLCIVQCFFALVKRAARCVICDLRHTGACFIAGFPAAAQAQHEARGV